MKDLAFIITSMFIGAVIGMLVMGAFAPPVTRFTIPELVPVEGTFSHELGNDRRWTAVLLGTGEFSVSMCDEYNVCATDGTGATGYRFDNAEDAKKQAQRLEEIRTRPTTTAEPIP